MAANDRQYIEHLGQQIQTYVIELRRQARCPQCGHDSLRVTVDGNVVHILCETPIGYEDGCTLHCPYTNTIAPVSISLPPFNLKFSNEEPRIRPVYQRRTAPRKSAITVKKKPRRGGKVCE